MDNLLSNYTNFMYCIKSIIEHIEIDNLNAEYYHEVSGIIIQYSHKSKKDITELIIIQENQRVKDMVSKEIRESIELFEELGNRKNINVRTGNRYFVDTYSLLMRYRNWFNKKFENSLNTVETSNANNVKEKNQSIILSDLITHKNGVEIIEAVKIQYKNIKGKRLKLLFLAFQDLDLLPKERIAQKFYDCCTKEFNWNIASYNAMNGYHFNNIVDNEEFENMKEYLTTLL